MDVELIDAGRNWLQEHHHQGARAERPYVRGSNNVKQLLTRSCVRVENELRILDFYTFY